MHQRRLVPLPPRQFGTGNLALGCRKIGGLLRIVVKTTWQVNCQSSSCGVHRTAQSYSLYTQCWWLECGEVPRGTCLQLCRELYCRQGRG